MTYRTGLAATVAFCAVLLGACGAPVSQTQAPFPSDGARPGDAGFSVVPANAPVGPLVDAFAINLLDTLQPVSISERREYCGYILVDRNGRLSATQAQAGFRTGCNMNEPLRGQGVIASYHTHGAYAPDLDGEAPSAVDLAGDFRYGIDGYIATPGGRIWLVDFQTRTARMICGPNCVVADAAYTPTGERNLRALYSLPDLQRRALGQ